MTNDPFGGRVSKEAAFKYKEVFETEAGQIVLMDLAKRFHMFSSTFKPGVPTEELLLKEGQRTVAMHIFAAAEVDPNQLLSNARKEINHARR